MYVCARACVYLGKELCWFFTLYCVCVYFSEEENTSTSEDASAKYAVSEGERSETANNKSR